MDTTEESIYIRIAKYIKETLKKSDSEVSSMRLSEKMSLIEMKDKDKWNEFKIGLRKSGYII